MQNLVMVSMGLHRADRDPDGDGAQAASTTAEFRQLSPVARNCDGTDSEQTGHSSILLNTIYIYADRIVG